MPTRPPTACHQPGCAGLVRNGICSVCGPLRQSRDTAYDMRRGSSAARGYDGRWQKVREQVLLSDPLCAVCGALAADVDHITPIRAGGDILNRDNLQPLCRSCHNQKTRRENKGSTPAQVTLVCGPPGSGKTSYVMQRKAWGDLVIDLDAIMVALTGEAWYDKPDNLLPLALDVRDYLYQRIPASIENVNRVWIVAGEPDPAKRQALARRLGARVVVLALPASECVRRIANDPRRADKWQQWAPLVVAWWQQYQPVDGETVVGW